MERNWSLEFRPERSVFRSRIDRMRNEVSAGPFDRLDLGLFTLREGVALW